VTARGALDFVAYVLIALALAAIAIGFAEGDIDSKWFALLFETALVFGWVIGYQRRKWRRPEFWLLCLFTLAVHLTLAVAVLVRAKSVRAFWVSCVFVLETSTIMVFINRFGTALSRLRREMNYKHRLR
jgi:hypothetical protein